MTDSPPPFDPGLLEVDDGVHLVGSLCRDCTRRAFPPRDECPWCGGSTTRTRLADAGTIVSFTVVHLPLPFHDAPTTVALVELDDGVQVQGVMRSTDGQHDAVGIDDPCRIAGLELATPEGPRTAYCFEPVDA